MYAILRKFSLTFISLSLLLISNSYAEGLDMENTLYLQLKDGKVVIQMLPDVAPKHVARIKELVRAKFYDGIVFHRVIEDFMAQAGDPTGTGAGGSDKGNIPAEFSTISHKRGIVSMARRGNDVNSANSQFFIVLADSTFLDGQYTVWGKVVEGMEFVDKIKLGEGSSGMVANPDKIVSIVVAADVAKKEEPKAKKAPTNSKKPVKSNT